MYSHAIVEYVEYPPDAAHNPRESHSMGLDEDPLFLSKRARTYRLLALDLVRGSNYFLTLEALKLIHGNVSKKPYHSLSSL